MSAEYAIEEVRAGPAVDEAYAALDAWFGPRGELERRPVIDAWLSTPEGRTVPPVTMRYHLLVARAPDGSLAAVRDCHVTVDLARRVCVVYLAHALVLPPHRRTGLAQRLRDAPVDLARRDLAAWAAADAEVMLAVEQEPAAPQAEDTIIRLVAYGRAGFKAIAPSVLPYCQPDFSDVAATGLPPRPLPLLAVVRHLGHEGEATLPARLAEAYVRHLYAVFSTHCRPQDLEAPRRQALDALAASGLERVPLLPLPRALDDHAAMAPLLEGALRRCLPAKH